MFAIIGVEHQLLASLYVNWRTKLLIMPCNNASPLSIAISILLLPLSLQLLQQSIPDATSLQQVPSFTIQLIYETQLFTKQSSSSGEAIINSTTVFNNSVQSSFVPVQNSLACSNLQLFTLKQEIWQHLNGTSFSLVLTNYQQPLTVQVTTYYSSPPLSQNVTNCAYSVNSTNLCTVGVTSECQADPKQYNIVIGRVYDANNGLVTQFWFNYICDYDMYYSSPLNHVAWGALAIVVFSIFMIFVSARFQEAKSFGNPTLYINYPVIVVVNLVDTLKFILIGKDVPYTQQIINYTCVVLSFVIGIPCIMLCWCEFFYCFRKRWVKFACCTKGNFTLRAMDVFGLLVGTGALIGWFFSNSNTIVSDIIFVFIYFALIKVIKFGSLKIALITLACSLVLSIVFVVLYTQMQVLVNLNFFSNPLFLMAPIWTRIPNQRCSWYFLVSMLYPGMLLAYLQRFDVNRSSLIYCPTFLICYGIFSIVWFIVGSSINIPLPYDVFTVPISMVLLVLFANRRGELEDLWLGRFYDAQKNYYQNEQEMMANLTVQKTKSNYTYDKSLFQNLKYGEYSESSRSSKDSRFSQIIKDTHTNMKQDNEMKHMYSQGEDKKKKKAVAPEAVIRSDETERVSDVPLSSAMTSNRWTLSVNNNP